MIVATKIKPREVLGSSELVEKFVDDWNWKHVADGVRVEGFILDAGAPCAITFLDK
jgi:uncharacterized protein (DUF2132 family)